MKVSTWPLRKENSAFTLGRPRQKCLVYNPMLCKFKVSTREIQADCIAFSSPLQNWHEHWRGKTRPPTHVISFVCAGLLRNHLLPCTFYPTSYMFFLFLHSHYLEQVDLLGFTWPSENLFYLFYRFSPKLHKFNGITANSPLFSLQHNRMPPTPPDPHPSKTYILIQPQGVDFTKRNYEMKFLLFFPLHY